MKTALATTLLAVLAATLSLTAAAQSLGEVARNQPATKKAKRVVTEDDIPPSTEASSSSQSDTVADSKDQEEKTSNGDKSGGPPVAKPLASDRVASLKAKVNELISKQQEYETNIAQLEKKVQASDSDFRAQMYKDALENNRHSLKVVTQQRESAEGELAELQDKMKSGSSGKAQN